MTGSWTFGRRLALGFGALLLLNAVTAFVAVSGLDQAVESKDRVIQTTAQNLIDGEALRSSVNAESAWIRGYLLTGDSRFLDRVAQANREFDELIGRIRARQPTAEERSLLQQIQQAAAGHGRVVEEVLELRRNEPDLQLVARSFEQKVAPRFADFLRHMNEFIVWQQSRLEQSRAEANADAASASGLVLTLTLGMLLLGVVLAAVLTRGLTRQIGSSVQHVRSSSAELQTAASQQASGVKEQATAMNEVANTIREVLATSKEIAESAQRVARVASETAGSARAGTQSVAESRTALDNIREQVDVVVQHMLNLGRKSQQIGGIVEIINELAEQTNILAINATIEAAGAGEAGRRFAVVGDEIRKLADRVGASTKQIRELIDEVRAAVNATVMATETGSKTVDAGAERFGDLESAFRRIIELVETTTAVSREIELSTKQQATAVEQVDLAIANVAQATRETEAGTGQTLQTASELAALSDRLAQLIQARAAVS